MTTRAGPSGVKARTECDNHTCDGPRVPRERVPTYHVRPHGFNPGEGIEKRVSEGNLDDEDQRHGAYDSCPQIATTSRGANKLFACAAPNPKPRFRVREVHASLPLHMAHAIEAYVTRQVAKPSFALNQDG